MQPKQKMIVGRSLFTLRLLPLFLHLLVTTVGGATITNRCSYTMQPAALPGGGVKLKPGESWNNSCPSGTDYQIVFCPPIDFPDSSSAADSPTPMATVGAAMFNVTNQCSYTMRPAALPGVKLEPREWWTRTCPSGNDYQIIFCPQINLVAQPAATNSPTPTVTGTTSVNSSSFTRSKVFGVIAGSVTGFILLVVFISLIAYKRRTRKPREVQEEDEELGELPGIPMRFTFQQLEEATDQFREKLGEGGFGSVFEGKYGEQRIAVKRLDRAGRGNKEFLAEVQTIGSIHHINLVRLIGFCAEKSHRLLVYEYMPKGSLERWIFYRHENYTPLDWPIRCKIITDIAKGLSYLHEECMKRIAHLDVKPQNILLDENFNAKLSDFGLCKLIDRDKSQVITRMRGTPGYLAPEWLTSEITEKADVYSFGVVVMEIISGRKNLDTSRSEESIHLITLLEQKVKSDKLADLLDKNSSDMQAHKQQVIDMMNLAMWCLQIDCKNRPRMSEVVKVLEGNMNAESNIDHNFVATNAKMCSTVENISSSDPPLASDISGPR